MNARRAAEHPSANADCSEHSANEPAGRRKLAGWLRGHIVYLIPLAIVLLLVVPVGFRYERVLNTDSMMEEAIRKEFSCPLKVRVTEHLDEVTARVVLDGHRNSAKRWGETVANPDGFDGALVIAFIDSRSYCTLQVGNLTVSYSDEDLKEAYTEQQLTEFGHYLRGGIEDGTLLEKELKLFYHYLLNETELGRQLRDKVSTWL